MINYNSKIKSMLKRVLSEEGFTYWRQNAFIRVKNDVPQTIFYERNRLFNSIRIQVSGNKNTIQMCSDSRYQLEYFFTSNEDFYKQLDVVEQEIKDKWIPYLNRKVEEYTVTTTLMKEYNEKTDEYVQKVLENHKFPETIEELVDIVKELYQGKEVFNKEQKDEAICMAASLLWEYLIRNYPEFKPSCGKYDPKELVNVPRGIQPLRIAFSSFLTDDYDGFKTRTRIWDIKENRNWVKKTEWEQNIY